MNSSTIDPAELRRFSALAREWWDPDGKFRPLHRLNPVRLAYIRDRTAERFGRDVKAARPFAGLRILDVGCGGGLVSEPLARLGANIVGIDPARENIEVARLHAAQSDLAIDYRATTAEALLDAGENFDVVLALEVVEHVADAALFVQAIGRLVRPGGLAVFSTINRTARAFALAIVGAEYILGWLPRGTHTYEKLVRPEELRRRLTAAGLEAIDATGIVYDPLTGDWRLSARDLAVNYMMSAGRPG